jgi:hypothetical protein
MRLLARFTHGNLRPTRLTPWFSVTPPRFHGVVHAR